ncbi:MAG TPA: hypothetical protein VMS45_10585 [Gemmatimonadaceae bacterium]|nr:hypothetical protein [Gemmatimonadaceae bacterium]
MATLELRPRSATEIVDASFQLLRANFMPLVTLSVAVQLPMLVVRIWAVRNALNFTTASAQVMSSLVGSVLIFGVLLFLLALVAQCALTVATSQVYLGMVVDNGAALQRGLQRALWVVLTYIVVAVGLGIAFGVGIPLATALPSVARIPLMLVLVAVAIWLGLRLIPLLSVLVLEDGGPIDAIKRALYLGNGLVGHMFVSMLLGGLIYVGIAIVAAVAVAALGAVIPALKDPSVTQVFEAAAGALVYPLLIAVAVVLYYDLRIRREGFDVEMMSRAVPR